MPRKGRRRTKAADGEGGGGDDDGGDDGGAQQIQQPQLLDELPQPPPQQHHHHQHQRGQASYDAAEDLRLQQVPVATEPIDEMNLRVLQNYEPTIRSIEAIAASSVVYAFSSETGGWVKADPQIEGTLFLCEQAPLEVDPFVLPRACVFVLNRKGLMNIVVDLARVSAAEVTDGLISLVIEDEAGTTGNVPQVLGLWIHGNGAAGSGSGMDGPQFDPGVVVRRWQAIHTSLQEMLGTSRLADTATILDAGVMVSKLNLAARGLNPDGIATSAIGPQPNVREVMAMVLSQASGHGVTQEG
ncbi:hypothetical protein SEUCBS139899_006495 [Sporothrix eucalyptigena]|uniref:Decapping enzyme n=1 Tax=Sporothrix eucalyptigena TaxID=1812306 RepID=A0ABP0CJY5_9PEZI